jgi:hypothetical protein
MAQKSLLDHSKGGSASWQMMGVLQTVISGIIPGNRNSECVSVLIIASNSVTQLFFVAHFQAHQFLTFPSKSIHTDGIRAGVMVLFFVQNNFSQHLRIVPSLPSALVKWAALPLLFTLATCLVFSSLRLTKHINLTTTFAPYSPIKQ